MIPEEVPFGGRPYFLWLGILVFARAMDFLSTWIATPNLVLEANPIARRLGWKWGLPLNIALCVGFARYPLPTIIIATTSVLVAARNFQVAWLMRAAGEQQYRYWMLERMEETSLPLFLFCLFAQTLLVAAVGVSVVWFSVSLVPQGIGLGIVGYALAVTLFTLISLWRGRRAAR